MNQKSYRKHPQNGNGPTANEGARLGIKVVNNPKEKDLADFDLLPKIVRDAVNYSPIVHWSAVQVMVFWNMLADERPDLNIEERAVITVNLINGKNRQTIIIANKERELYVQPLGFTNIKKKRNAVEAKIKEKALQIDK